MSKREAILIVSRAISFYLVCWVFADLTYVPAHVRAVPHYLRMPTATVAYYRDYYVLDLISLLLRIAVFSAAAIWFYNCGPRIYGFVLPEGQAEVGE